MTLAERITYVREKVLGLSQKALAAKLGVERGAVSNWERGKGIGNKNLKALASLAKASLDWLVNETGEPPPIGLNSEIYDFIANIAIREAESRHLDLKEPSARDLAEAIAKAIVELHIERQSRDHSHPQPPSPLIASPKSKKRGPPKAP